MDLFAPQKAAINLFAPPIAPSQASAATVPQPFGPTNALSTAFSPFTGSVSGSTPSTYVAPGAANFLPNLIGAVARAPAQAGAMLVQTGKQLVTGQPEVLTPDNPVSKLILGDAPVQSLQEQGRSAQSALPGVPAPVIALGVASNEVLNLLPFGGKTNVLKDIVAADDIAKAGVVAQKLGLHPDLWDSFAHAAIDIKSTSDAEALLNSFSTLQKSTVSASATTEAVDHASQTLPQEAAADAGQSLPLKPSVLSPLQDTINKVELGVKGTGVGQRVRSAIASSEAIATQITNRGQDAVIAGRALSADDLKLAEQYETGVPITDLAAKASNPAKVTDFLNKLSDYYDFRLAADRAAGGETARIPNYIPHNWDLTKPEDLARFNELAKQKGLQTYDGFRSQPRVFNSYAEGEAQGFVRKNPTILQDLRSDYQGASSAISRQTLKQGLNQAVPDMVSMSGYGKTAQGKSFVNSNIPGLEGISYHPQIDRLLQGFQPLKHPDFIDLVKKRGAETAINKTGIAGMVDRTVAMAQSIPKNAKEAGMTGVLGSIYDHVANPMKQLLWNFSGFHSVNITLSHLGASGTHPLTGAKGVLQSVGSAVSERLYTATINSYKALMVTDAEGTSMSVFDWAVKSGAYEPRALPAEGITRFNPLASGKAAIFDREIPVLQLNLAEQAAKKGIVADSPAGVAVGKEIRTITGEINAKTMNINPNTLKVATRAFLAPGFTYSKYKTLLDSFTAWGAENGAAGNMARTAVIGKSAIIGTAATLGTLLATGKFPALQQILLNYSVNPSMQTNLTNPKGSKLDVTFPKTFLSEGASAILNPIQYGNARLNPLIADMLKLYTGKDYYGNPLIDPDVPESRTLQLAKNLGIGHLPIGMQSIVNQMLGKQTGTQSAIQIAGLGTRISESDPTKQKYAGVDAASAQISKIAPDDPERLSKMQDIFNSLTPDQRKSLAYQELMAGVSTKGIYTSEVERQYFQVQDLLQQGKTAEAAAITQAMSPQDYQTYKSIKTRLTNEALFTKVQTLMQQGDVTGATALTASMSKTQYKSYQTWKANNSPSPATKTSPSSPTSMSTAEKVLGFLTGADTADASTGGSPAPQQSLLSRAAGALGNVFSSTLTATNPKPSNEAPVQKIIAGIANNETGGVKTDRYSFSKPDGAGGTDLGKYQVNTETLKELSPKYLGRLVSPQEFLASPALQDAFMSARTLNLLSQGYTPEQVADTHRNGSTTPPGSTTYKRPDYVKKFKAFISQP